MNHAFEFVRYRRFHLPGLVLTDDNWDSNFIWGFPKGNDRQMSTEKQNLSLPQKGTTDWNIPLNENFKKLDAAAILQVTTVDELRSNYTPTDQTFAFIEQAREFWAGTGSTWVRVGYVKQTKPDLFVQSTEPGNASEGDVWIVP